MTAQISTNSNSWLKLRKAALDSYAWIGVILIVVANFAFSGIYFFNTFPLSEGWFVNYVELFLQGNVPYRDFYYYLPPFTLILDTIFWKLSFGLLIVFRGWYLAQRILLYLLVYRFLCRYFNWKLAALACVISEIICTADDFDFFGDYNQSNIFLVVLIAYAASDFVEATDLRKKLHHMFKAGIGFGLLFLCKQTSVVAGAIIYFTALIVYCLLHKDKRFGYYVSAVAAGVVIPIVVVFIYLIANDAFVPFVQQVFFSAQGKGSLFDIVIGTPATTMGHKMQWALALVVFLLTLLAQGTVKSSRRKNCISVLLIIVAVLLTSLQFNFVSYFQAILSSPKYLILLVVLAFPALFVYWRRKKLAHYERWFALAIVFWCVCFLGGTIYSKAALYAFYNNNQFHLIESMFNVVVVYYQICWLAYSVVQIYKGSAEAKKYESLAMFACGGLTACYASSMAAGSNVFASLSLRITTPLILCTLFSVLSRDRIIRWLRALLYMFCGILVTLTCAQKAICAYPWWGMTNAPMWDKTYTVDIPELRGIKFSKDDKEMYESITKMIKENSDENDLILGFPYIKIFNILCNRYESNFVPVIWYDVVGDAYVEETLYELEKDLPDIVIWKEIPGALQAHEGIYRQGTPLVQRKILYLFREVLPTDYILLGDINGLKVYKLKGEVNASGQSVEMDGNLAIEWIEENVTTNEVQDSFAGGNGTAEDPYRIETSTQLMNFSTLVNNGYRFTGQYVIQTCDLDMAGYAFTPIGLNDLESSFDGIYDGRGHIIRNLTINCDEDAGLFGVMNGSVYNLGLEGGSIYGGRCGAIAATSTETDSKIVNCYTDINVSGERAGGLADNFVGRVANAFSSGKLVGTESAGAISDYCAQDLTKVFVAQENVTQSIEIKDLHPIANGDPRVLCGKPGILNGISVINELNSYVKEYNKQIEGAGIQSDNITLVYWKAGVNGHPIFASEE